MQERRPTMITVVAADSASETPSPTSSSRQWSPASYGSSRSSSFSSPGSCRRRSSHGRLNSTETNFTAMREREPAPLVLPGNGTGLHKQDPLAEAVEVLQRENDWLKGQLHDKTVQLFRAEADKVQLQAQCSHMRAVLLNRSDSSSSLCSLDSASTHKTKHLRVRVPRAPLPDSPRLLPTNLVLPAQPNAEAPISTLRQRLPPPTGDQECAQAAALLKPSDVLNQQSTECGRWCSAAAAPRAPHQDQLRGAVHSLLLFPSGSSWGSGGAVNAAGV